MAHRVGRPRAVEEAHVPYQSRRGVAPLAGRASDPRVAPAAAWASRAELTSRSNGGGPRPTDPKSSGTCMARDGTAMSPPGSKRAHQAPTLATLRYGVHSPRKRDPQLHGYEA